MSAEDWRLGFEAIDTLSQRHDTVAAIDGEVAYSPTAAERHCCLPQHDLDASRAGRASRLDQIAVTSASRRDVEGDAQPHRFGSPL